jgi:hypothetical protein
MDFTDYDKRDFLGYAKKDCQCGGNCESCSNNEFNEYCGCGSHNYSGCGCSGNYQNYSIRQGAEVSGGLPPDNYNESSEGDPIPDPEPITKGTFMPKISEKNKYVTIALLLAAGYVGYKYIVKPKLK